MRLLFTIAHFYSRDGAGNYGSRTESPRQRMAGLTACVASLHQVFGRSQHVIDWSRAGVAPANRSLAHDVDVIICTTRGRHLLAGLPLPGRLYTHHPTRAAAMRLGFECQAVLREHLGRYDYYCFLEDDTVLHDPWFFTKLKWFTEQSGGGLLQPNRYEVSPALPLRKVYVDGDLPPHLTAPHQDVRERPVIARRIMGTRFLFHRARNPHAAGYFLSAEQMAHWARQRHFLDRDTSFVGPLESAATLGIMRAFRVYKPAVSNAGFLEVQHFGSRFLRLSGQAVRELEETRP